MNEQIYKICGVSTDTFCWCSQASSRGRRENEYLFSVVPQQTKNRTVAAWRPLLDYLESETGAVFHLLIAKSFLGFEKELENGVPHFSYMNPYQYTRFHERSGYTAQVKAKNKKIQGIIVIQRDSPIKKLSYLNGQEIVFPTPHNFAATILPQAYLRKQNIGFSPSYVGSHDNVYLNVAFGRIPAGGGVLRTLNALTPDVAAKLHILWMTEGFTPHAIAASPRTSIDIVNKVRQALTNLADKPSGTKILKDLKVEGFIGAKDSDWDDVRKLNIEDY